MDGHNFEYLRESLEQAFVNRDREKVAYLRDQLNDLASADLPSSREAAALAQGATDALEKASDFVVECTEEDPFAPAYISLENGRAYYRCSHDPSHSWPA